MLYKIDPATYFRVNFPEEFAAMQQAAMQTAAEGGVPGQQKVGPDGKPGYFKQELNVYGRQGLSCYICQYKIEKIKQSGRSTFFCPHCQTDC